MNKKKKEATVISLIFAFVQTLLMVLLVSLMLLYSVLLTPSSIMRNLKRSDYYVQVRAYTLDSIGDILIPSGLPESIIDDVFMIDAYQENVNGYITDVMNGEPHEFDISLVEAHFTAKIMDFIETEGLTGYVEQDTIDRVVEAVIDRYESGMRFPLLSTLSTYITQYRQILLIVVPVSLLIILFCAFMLFKINKWKHRFIRYQAYAFGATALMICVIPIALMIWGGHERIAIQPEYINNFIVYHINFALHTFLFLGVCLLIGELVLIRISEKMKKHVRHRVRSTLPDDDVEDELKFE